jgi:hypothetical protein
MLTEEGERIVELTHMNTKCFQIVQKQFLLYTFKLFISTLERNGVLS